MLHSSKKSGLKIAFMCPDDFTAWHFYRGILKELNKRGLATYVVSKPGDYVGLLRKIGTTHIPLDVARFINPLKDLKSLWRVYKICKTYRFDIVHNFFLKLNLYGAIGARLAGVKSIVNTIEGLGFAYTEPEGFMRRASTVVVDKLNTLACGMADRVWFVNEDDMREFVSRGIIAREKTVLIRSHGINLQEYSITSLDSSSVKELEKEIGIDGQTKIITMVVARAIWSKGIREFAEASTSLKGQHLKAKFILVAPMEEDSPQSVPEEYLKSVVDDKFLWLSVFRKDVKELISVSDIVVLPSYYREGVPTVLLEAMAMGKPIVTTNHVGCKEVVEEEENGFLVPIKDSRALAEAISKLLADDVKRRRFGYCSRVKAEKEFDEEKVVAQVMDKLYGLGRGCETFPNLDEKNENAGWQSSV